MEKVTEFGKKFNKIFGGSGLELSVRVTATIGELGDTTPVVGGLPLNTPRERRPCQLLLLSRSRETVAGRDHYSRPHHQSVSSKTALVVFKVIR